MYVESGEVFKCALKLALALFLHFGYNMNPLKRAHMIISINGKIVDETRDTLIVEKGQKRLRLPKENYSFEFREGNSLVRIRGSLINKRAEDRLKIKVRW